MGNSNYFNLPEEPVQVSGRSMDFKGMVNDWRTKAARQILDEGQSKHGITLSRAAAIIDVASKEAVCAYCYRFISEVQDGRHLPNSE